MSRDTPRLTQASVVVVLGGPSWCTRFETIFDELSPHTGCYKVCFFQIQRVLLALQWLAARLQQQGCLFRAPLKRVAPVKHKEKKNQMGSPWKRWKAWWVLTSAAALVCWWRCNKKKKKKQQPRLSDETKIDKHELLSASFRQSVGHRDQKMAGWVCDWSPNKLHLRMQTEFENVFTFYLWFGTSGFNLVVS